MTTLPSLYDADLLRLIRATDGSEPCATTDPDLWHATDSNQTGPRRTEEIRRAQALAKRLCHDCRIRDLCADYALTHPDETTTGVWGGLDPADRAALTGQPKPPTTADECGSYRGHSRHQREGEQACADCREAAQTYWQARRAKNRKKAAAA